jgi:hypothetical protein
MGIDVRDGLKIYLGIYPNLLRVLFGCYGVLFGELEFCLG